MPESSFKDLTILVTGGGGYIGSHCILQLLEHKFKVVAIDNFNNAVKGTHKLNFKIYRQSSVKKPTRKYRNYLHANPNPTCGSINWWYHLMLFLFGLG